MSHHNNIPVNNGRRDLRPDISIVDPTVPVAAAAAAAVSASNLHAPIVHYGHSSGTTYRKLRRFNGDIQPRMGSNSSLCHCSISVGATLLLLIAQRLLAIPAAEAAYLTGVHHDSKLPVTTTPSPAKPNERYAFLTRPRDKYFTSTGVLPALSPSKREDLAKILPTTSSDSSSSKEEILVTYTNDPKSVDRWLCKNLPYDGCFLGFDIERVPEARSMHSDRKERSLFAHAAVVQLATTNACLVVHLVDTSCGPVTHPKHNHNPCARILRSVLEDPSIIKAGCSIDEDLVLLHEVWGGKTSQTTKVPSNGGSKNEKNGPQQHHPKPKKQRVAVVKTNGNHRHQSYSHGPALQARSRFDLGCVVLPKTNPRVATGVVGNDLRYTPFLSSKDFHQSRDGDDGHSKCRIVAKRTTTINHKSGLQGLCKAILGVDLPKERENCASDWTRFPLTDDQITYAARDAWAGAAIATKLASMEVEPKEHPSSSKKANVFSRCNLIKVLRGAETPLPQLAQRHRQRKEAKVELRNLLHPYSKNLFRNEQDLRQHLERQQAKTQPFLVPSKNTHKHAYTNGTTTHNNNIDVDALFATYPLSGPRTLANYAQKQQALMEKSLPKEVRERTMELRQMVNAKVIDHRVVFEIDIVHPGETAEGEEKFEFEPKKEESQQQQHYFKGCKSRRNSKIKVPNNFSTRSHR